MAYQVYQQTLPPTVASTQASNSGVSWSNPNNIKTDNGSSSSLIFSTPNDQNGRITASSFGFKVLPPSAVIDGIAVKIDGFTEDCSGTVALNITGAASELAINLNKVYGGPTSLWGLSSVTATDINNLAVTVNMRDLGTGMGYSSIDYLTVTVYWHLELSQAVSPTLPTTFAYKVYTQDDTFLGELPNVTSPFSFPQDINSAGAVLKTTCATSPKPTTTLSPILDNNGLPILSNDSLEILGTSTDSPLLPGASADEALFKNGNRLKVWMYSKWYPNGKLMFSGQINRIDFQIGGSESITITTYSDGIELDNYIARGYPFAYTIDQQQTTNNNSVTVSTEPISLPGYIAYGQTVTTGASGDNIGQIQLMLLGSANVTVALQDGPGGNFLASSTKNVVGATFSTATSFDFSTLIPTGPLTQYYFQVTVDRGESISLGINNAGGYAGGTAYKEDVPSGASSVTPVAQTFDLWFKTGVGTPTTTTTYTSQDPVTEIAGGVIADYNSRGGRVQARTLVAAGYDITYTFNSATILSAIQKMLEAAPSGYYSYIDLGTAEIDIMPTSSDPDFIVVIGKDISSLDFSMTIERVKNYFLFSGGDIGGGVNLFKQYQDIESSDDYGQRLAQQSDNRVTLDATADALGDSFIEENSGEIHETTVVLLNEAVDISLYVPGKTIGFRNTGMFTDDLVLQIVRREFNKDFVKLTVGRLPITQTAEIQRINRDLLYQQTIANPDQPE